MRIPDYIIARINAEADLVSIIKRHTTLKPAGKEFKGCCPFHGEKTPSFYVNPASNLYYCFGCGAKGNAISFLVDYERLSFIEAVKELSEQTGIELPKEDTQKISYQKSKPAAVNAPLKHAQKSNQTNQDSVPPKHINTDSHQKATVSIDSPSRPTHTNNPQPAPTTPAQATGNLYELLLAVTAYYQDRLYKHPVALQYFLDRGVSHQTIHHFQLGYAPDGWQQLENAFPYDIQGLTMLGLIRTSQNGRTYDLLRDRVIFPIKDKQGQIVGFAGRAMSDDVIPKYLNSSDSVVFSKQHILYGYYESRQQRANRWLIVEGYMDVIALYQAGIYGAVAPMGTAVNEGQISGLLKFNDTLTLCFDGDKAGQKAALRTLEVAMPVLPDGKSLKFLVLPSEHDPDTYIKANGASAMQAAIDVALPLSDYLYGVFADRYDLTSAENKATAMAELKELTQKLPKGSTFRFWLNDDMYRRFRQANKPPQQAPIKADSVTPIEQLFLSILYKPTLLSPDPLADMYSQAGLYQLDEQFAHTPYFSPLPHWHTLPIEGLSELVDTTVSVLPLLITPTGDPIQDAAIIDSNAHLILATIATPDLQANLKNRWRDFFYHARHNPICEIEFLFKELLFQIIKDVLATHQQTSSNLDQSRLYKRRLIALDNWNKTTIQSSIQRRLDEFGISH